MPPTVKKSARKVEEVAEETAAPIEEAQPPVVKEHHRVVRTWESKRPLDDPDDEIEIEDVEEEVETVSEPIDPIARLLHEIGASRSSWAMHVSRLPKYGRDERTDPKSRVFVGTLTIPDAQYLAEGKYLEDIQARFAKGQETNHFYCCVRKDNRNYSYLPVVSVEPPDPITAAKAQVENPGAPITIFQTPQADGFDQFVKQAKRFAELRDLLFPQTMLEKMQPPPQQHNEALTTERALMHLVSQDQNMLDGIVGRLLKPSGGAKEISFMELAFEAIKNDTLPKMIKEAKALLLETRSMQQLPDQPPLSPAPIGAMNAPPVAPAPMPAVPTPPPASSNIPPEIQLLNFAVQAHVQGWPPKAAADWIIEFEEQNPSVAPYVTGFLGMQSDQALNWLTSTIPNAAHLADSPKAAEWIADLQAALNPEPDEAA